MTLDERHRERGADEGRTHVGVAVVVAPAQVMAVSPVGRRDFVEHLPEIGECAVLVLDRRQTAGRAGAEYGGDTGLQARVIYQASDLCGDVPDIAVATGAYVQFLGNNHPPPYCDAIIAHSLPNGKTGALCPTVLQSDVVDILKGLNPQQQKAVTASDGPVLVLAGPGSGKTRVLTHRVAWLVLELDVAPWRIMAVTFTNKAAREMRERLERLLGPSRARSLTLGTFHATCARILRRETDAAGIPRDYAIFDADDQRRLVKQAVRDLNLDDKRYRPQAVHGAISRAKNELITPEAYTAGSYYGEVVKRIYERYQALLAANSGLDFDDLLMVTVRAFSQNPDVLAKYQERYRYILVDEFQDTNQAQYALLQQLSGRYHNLFCVADEDQSIYAWRGADYRNIRRLRDDHPDLLTILLEQNYRSTQTILDAAHAVIRHNPDRTDKSLFTRRGRGPEIVLHEAYDQDDEALFVVNTIAQQVAQEGMRPGDCAVMYRTNAQSRALEDAFVRAGLPYKLVGATRFYARREIKDVIAFLRLIHNPTEGVSMARVINVPPRGIGQKTVATLEETARARGVSVYEVIQDMVHETNQGPELGARARRVLESFLEMLEGWISARDAMNAAQLIDRVLQDTRYGDYLRDGTEEGEDRWANVLELRNVAAEYEGLTLTEFLADVALVSDVDNLSDEADAPTLLTLHSAKGLEFPVVFITGLEDGLLPHSRSLDDPEQMAEERRLMYVGLTRAEDRLFLTYAFRRTRYGESEPSVPSRFLEDVPPELTGGSWRRRQGRGMGTRDMGRGSQSAIGGSPSRTENLRFAARNSQFRPGQRVRHATFGEGLVIESRPDGGDEIVTVVFEEAGLKRLMADIARLERLDADEAPSDA
jgi:DNA helicase-2/ATP-dependent DNA helicase PcrA